MGVHGLWKLLEPSGKPVTLETLENKVLAIDVSMWLHQVMKGYQDKTGNPLPNAHLLGLFHRICKLLFYKIRPIFVFDGGVPQLKQQTLAGRRQQRNRAAKQAEKDRLRLLKNLAEQTAVRQALGAAVARASVPKSNNKPSQFADFILAPLAETQDDESSSEDEVECITRSNQITITWDNFDLESEDYKKLTAQEKLELLNDLKESRKQNSWARIHEMPQESSDFSGFQLKRLLVRRSAQVGLEQVEKEMGEQNTLTMAELEELMREKGSLSQALDNLKTGHRIASDVQTRFLLIKNGQKEKTVNDDNADDDEDIPIEIDLTDDMEEENLSYEAEVAVMKAEIFALIEQLKNKPRIDLNIPSTSKDNNYSPVEETTLPPELVKCISEIKVPETSLQNTSTYHSNSSKSPDIVNDGILLTSKEIYSLPLAEDNITNKVNSAEAVKIVLPSTSKENNYPPVNDINTNNSDKSNNDEFPSTLTENNQFISENHKKVETLPRNEENICESIINKSPVGNVIDSVMLSSDSEDDFEEVPEEPAPTNMIRKEINSVLIERTETETNVEKMDDDSSDSTSDFEEVCDKSIEITIETKSNQLEDDIFADVFLEKQDEPNQENDNEVLIRPAVAIPTAELIQLESDLTNKARELEEEAGKQDRFATSITDQMCIEAQQLLDLFGLPYITAPMEAEAQCAILDLLELTNGTVTDDSDIWLFGGKTVYRNFFSQNKNAELYTSESITKCFKLTREQLILIALLVGSDYTCGLTGVGPVTALEILAIFSSNSTEDIVNPLKKFKQFWSEKERKTLSPKLKKLYNKIKDVNIHEGFPSEAVVQAYLNPTVNNSNEKFSWGKPNINSLIRFTREKFGWSKQRTDSILDPVLKRLNDNTTQKKIDSYFSNVNDNVSAENKMSNRVRLAVTQLGGEDELVDDYEDDLQPSTSTQKPKKLLSNTTQTKGNKRNLSGLEAMRKELTKKPRVKKTKDIEIKPIIKTKTDPTEEKIPQRELDKQIALKTKLKAIEIFRKRKLDGTKRDIKSKRVTRDEHYLSESSDDD